MAAVPVKMLLTKLRMRLGDMQKTKFSDYELLSALSDAWAMLWIALAENFSTLSRRVAEVTLTDGAGPLPDDFYSLVELSEGAIHAQRVEASGEKATLVYNCVPPGVADVAVESNIEFPLSFVLDLVEIAAAAASGDMGAAVASAGVAANRVGQKREWAKIPDIRHFP